MLFPLKLLIVFNAGPLHYQCTNIRYSSNLPLLMGMQMPRVDYHYLIHSKISTYRKSSTLELSKGPVEAKQIKLWTRRDPMLSKVLQFILYGWPGTKTLLDEEIRTLYPLNYGLEGIQYYLRCSNSFFIDGQELKTLLDEEIRTLYPR